MRDPEKQLDKLLVEQSSELHEAMKRGGRSERHALVDWLLQSKRHVRAHLFVAALEEELTHLDPQRRIPIPDVRGADLPAVAELTFTPPRTAARARTARIWAAAATVLIVVAATATYGPVRDHLRGWQEFYTAVGEQRSVLLTDGSIMQLNTQSRVKVQFSRAAREIRLLNGEAFFKVQHEAGRAFRVLTDDATIQAIGTQFNVHHLTGITKVAVIEGRVQVSSSDAPSLPIAPADEANTLKPRVLVLAAAGEEAEISSNGQIVRHPIADVTNAAAWIQRRIVFKQEPLIDVVSEFNRYRKSPQFRVDDSGLAARKYSGTFDLDDPNSLEQVLAEERDVTIDRSGDAVVIRRRAPRSTAPP